MVLSFQLRRTRRGRTGTPWWGGPCSFLRLEVSMLTRLSFAATHVAETRPTEMALVVSFLPFSGRKGETQPRCYCSCDQSIPGSPVSFCEPLRALDPLQVLKSSRGKGPCRLCPAVDTGGRREGEARGLDPSRQGPPPWVFRSPPPLRSAHVSFSPDDEATLMVHVPVGASQ